MWSRRHVVRGLPGVVDPDTVSDLRERYYLLRVPSFMPWRDGWEPGERAGMALRTSVDGPRSSYERRASGSVVAPRNLDSDLSGLLRQAAEGPLGPPIDVGV